MTTLLANVVSEGTGKGTALDRPTAGKTGSTQLPDTAEFAGIATDGSVAKVAWFIGYTPELTAAVWMGYDKTDSTHYLTVNSAAASRVFQEIMSRALVGQPIAPCFLITHQIFESLKENIGIRKPVIHHFIFELLMSSLKLIKDANGDINKILDQPEQLYADILSKQTMDEMQIFIDENMKRIVDYLAQLRRERPAKIIVSVIDYIHEHFNQEVTLKQVAEVHYINPGYLGKLFKKEIGSSFHDYLNKARIDKSKELLLTTHNFVYQVSELVGYKDYNYFHKTFKKYVGTTPSEFSQLYGHNEKT